MPWGLIKASQNARGRDRPGTYATADPMLMATLEVNDFSSFPGQVRRPPWATQE